MTTQEMKRANTGGVAYEVILKPASGEIRPPSPPKGEKTITHERIVKKLQEAEERRLSIEAEKLASIAKSQERAQEVLAKAQQENESFSRATQEKLRRSMEVTKENREAQIQNIQGRLRDHLLRVEEICRKSDEMTKELEERIKRNLDVKEENRNAKIDAIVKKLKEHEKHVEEVVKSHHILSKSRYSEEKVLQKVQKAIDNREKYLQEQRKKNREHEKKIEDVRRNKMALRSDDDVSTTSQ